jgi:hypothetical protein
MMTWWVSARTLTVTTLMDDLDVRGNRLTRAVLENSRVIESDIVLRAQAETAEGSLVVKQRVKHLSSLTHSLVYSHLGWIAGKFGGRNRSQWRLTHKLNHSGCWSRACGDHTRSSRWRDTRKANNYWRCEIIGYLTAAFRNLLIINIVWSNTDEGTWSVGTVRLARWGLHWGLRHCARQRGGIWPICW